MAAFALVAMPTAGQPPPPPCLAGAQVPPDRFEFTEDPDTSPTRSVAATHPVALFIGVDSGSLTSVTDPAIQIAGPPRLRGDPRTPIRRHDASEGRLHAGGARPSDL